MSKFKVGDRVRQNQTINGENLLEHWRVYWEHKEGPSDGTFFITRDIGDGWFSYSNKKNGNGPQIELRFIEIVEDQPMPTPEYSCIRVVPPSKPKREIVESTITLDGFAEIKVMTEECDSTDVKLLIQECPFFTAKALREAAALFTTLAEVLEENSNA